jgi:hypothetical protein
VGGGVRIRCAGRDDRARRSTHGVLPGTARFQARRALELAVRWAYKHDASLQLPHQDNLSALIHDPSFKDAAGEAVFSTARVINTLGNRAVHGHRAIPLDDAMVAVRELFHVTKTKFWQMLGRGTRRCSDLFGPSSSPNCRRAGCGR